MNQEFKNRWISSLRSEKYQQGTGKLRCGSNFCCLGVLCDIVDSSKWINLGYDIYVWITPIMGRGYSNIPFKLLDDLNISIEEERKLIEMNDSGISFIEIANYIEENL